MSYILDALNKAEKDRQQKTPADVSPISTPKDVLPQARGGYGLYVMVAIFITLMLWLFLNKEKTSPQHIIIPQKTKVITPKVKAKPMIQSQAVKSQPTQHIEKKPMPIQEVKVIPNIMALDSALRNQLPSITISAHIFSEDASKRMVIINNQVKHEQQYLAEDLQLVGITPHGIQLQFQGVDFTMSIKDQWPPY